MKDLPMFNKLFFVLCSSLLIALSTPSAGDEQRRTHTIQGAAGDYEIYGTDRDRRKLQEKLDSHSMYNGHAMFLQHARKRAINNEDPESEQGVQRLVIEVEAMELRVLESNLPGAVSMNLAIISAKHPNNKDPITIL